jgi:hypothetical protein
MRRVIRKRIRHQEDGLDLAADINAEIAFNVGEQRVSQRTSAHAASPDPEADAPDDAERSDATEPEGNDR